MNKAERKERRQRHSVGHVLDVESHRRKLERTCRVSPSSSGAREVSCAEDLERMFHESGLDRIAVYRGTGKSRGDVFEELHMSYPEGELTHFEQLSLYVARDLRIPTIKVNTQTDGPLLTIKELEKFFQTPVAKRNQLLNVTSFNLNVTGLEGLVVPPKIVRDLDLVSRAWPSQKMIRFYDDLVKNPFAFSEERKLGSGATTWDVYSPPKTMKYLLLGPQGAYTDWHVDFAGSSVWYHVIKGRKVFMAAPSTSENVTQFLKWSKSSSEQKRFLGSQLEQRVRVELNQGDTMFLPGGWFHAVSTPEDSVVVGGNYINPLRLQEAFKVRCIETQLNISPKAEYPKFNMLMYYAAGDFIKRSQRAREMGCRLMHRTMITTLEFKGLGGLAIYLESLAKDLMVGSRKRGRCNNTDGGIRGKTKGEMAALHEDIVADIQRIVSFLRREFAHLQSLYSSNHTDAHNEVPSKQNEPSKPPAGKVARHCHSRGEVLSLWEETGEPSMKQGWEPSMKQSRENWDKGFRQDKRRRHEGVSEQDNYDGSFDSVHQNQDGHFDQSSGVQRDALYLQNLDTEDSISIQLCLSSSDEMR
jgi:hypothetical protein